MTRVPGANLGLLYCSQPFGFGIVTIRSVSLSGATGCPTTPAPSRYCAIGTGGSVDDGLVLVVEVVSSDVEACDLSPRAAAATTSTMTIAAMRSRVTESRERSRVAWPTGCLVV